MLNSVKFERAKQNIAVLHAQIKTYKPILVNRNQYLFLTE